MKDDIAHLNLLSDLTEYIHRDHPPIEALCQFAVLRTFNHLGAAALFASQLGSDAKIRQIGSFGLEDRLKESWTEISIDDHLPVSDCIRTNQLHWLASAEDWQRNYPELMKYKIDENAKTFIAWPIKIKRAPMSMLGLMLRDTVAPTQEEVMFLTTVGGLFALHLSATADHPVPNAQSEEDRAFAFLSRRQKEILMLMADGLTNAEIGTELAFSESTIRQETMRIYEIFEAAGRSDAIRKYREVTHGQ